LLHCFRAQNLIKLKHEFHFFNLSHDFLACFGLEGDCTLDHLGLLSGKPVDAFGSVVLVNRSQCLHGVKPHKLHQLIIVVALKGVFTKPVVKHFGDREADWSGKPHQHEHNRAHVVGDGQLL
jgi:hypothetical protein